MPFPAACTIVCTTSSVAIVIFFFGKTGVYSKPRSFPLKSTWGPYNQLWLLRRSCSAYVWKKSGWQKTRPWSCRNIKCCLWCSFQCQRMQIKWVTVTASIYSVIQDYKDVLLRIFIFNIKISGIRVFNAVSTYIHNVFTGFLCFVIHWSTEPCFCIQIHFRKNTISGSLCGPSIISIWRLLSRNSILSLISFSR